jgi:hypothetical protein
LSDRAATKVKFDDIFTSYRTDILKDRMGENWDLLNDGELKFLTPLDNFSVDCISYTVILQKQRSNV